MSDKVLKLVSKPVFAGISAAVLSALVFGNLSQSVTVLGVSLPAPILTAGVVGAASFGADLVSGIILPHIDKESASGRIETKLLLPAVSGVSLVTLSLVLGVSQQEALLKMFALGVGAEVSATYGYSIFKDLVAKK